MPLCLGGLPATLTCLTLALSAVAAAAQDSTPPAGQRVEVRSDAAEQRRSDIAGRQVVRREELLRHGDTRLADAMQRVPGITVEVRGSSTELKLGGLGAGYTQILLNGEPLPRGVSLDSIALDSIERVEIVRGATVDSSQAIAGSINFITRRATATSTRDYRLQAATQWSQPQLLAAFNFGGKNGALTWGLGTVLSHEDQVWPATFLQERREHDPPGSTPRLTQKTLTHKRERDRTDALSLNPRLAWQAQDAGGVRTQFSTDHSLRYARSSGGVRDVREALFGALPAQQESELGLNYKRLFWRGRVQWQRREADGAQWEMRLNGSYSRRDQDSRLLGFDFTPRPVQDSSVQGLALDQSTVLNMNHQRPVGAAHRLLLGFEVEEARRRENRTQTEVALVGGLPPQNFDERYDARVQRRAFYVQDEWTRSEALALQAGLRWEQLHSQSEGNVFDAVVQTHQLVGPVLRVSVQPKPGSGTFKLGLSRGFKLPAPRDVMPRRYVPIEVSPTAPAQAGNPDLRPERAWSLDGSWQGKWSPLGADVVLSANFRRIEDVMLDRLIEQPQVLGAAWLLQRFNAGRAWTAGLELELRGRTKTPLPVSQPLRWQASMGLARSRLLDVSGARPALPGQADWQLKLDMTQGFSAGWTAQLGLEARGQARADLPSERQIQSLARHGWNASLSWQPQPRRTWRLTASQLGATDDVDIKTVRVLQAGVPVSYTAREAWHKTTLWRLGLESAF